MPSKKAYTFLLFLGLTSSLALAQAVGVSDFFLVRNGKSVVVHWTIDSGFTCNGIKILRAADTLNFSEIGYIAGICGSTAEPKAYSFEDKDPLRNQTNYYRLQFGLSQVSVIRSIWFEYLEGAAVIVRSDPAGQWLGFRFNNYESDTLSFRMYTVNGKEVFVTEKVVSNEVEVNTSELPEGTYIYRLSNGNKRRASGKVRLRKP